MDNQQWQYIIGPDPKPARMIGLSRGKYESQLNLQGGV